MKKNFFVLSIALTLLISLSGISVVYADTSDSNYSMEREFCTKFISNLGIARQITDYIPLKNVDNEIEAVVFDIEGNGYVVVNTNDLSIPEFSMEAKNPYKSDKNFSKSKDYVYNGPVSYFVKMVNYLMT